jgi:hypothetical protein
MQRGRFVGSVERGPNVALLKLATRLFCGCQPAMVQNVAGKD